MHQPRATLWAVVVSTGRTDFKGKLFFPVHALWYVWYAEPIFNTHAGMRIDQLPREFIGANIQTTPALSIGDKACDGHRTLKQYGKLIAFLNVFPVTRVGTANFFCCIKFVGVL